MINDSYFNCSAILRTTCIISYINIQSARKSFIMGKFLTSVTLCTPFRHGTHVYTKDKFQKALIRSSHRIATPLGGLATPPGT